MNPPSLFQVSRCRFLQTAFAVSPLGSFGANLVNRPPPRVGLIGAGWYGKSDLWRLNAERLIRA